MRKRGLLLLSVVISSHLPSDLMNFKNLAIPNDANDALQGEGTNGLIFSLDLSTTKYPNSELRLQHPLFKKLKVGEWDSQKLPNRQSTSYFSCTLI